MIQTNFHKRTLSVQLRVEQVEFRNRKKVHFFLSFKNMFFRPLYTLIFQKNFSVNNNYFFILVSNNFIHSLPISLHNYFFNYKAYENLNNFWTRFSFLRNQIFSRGSDIQYIIFHLNKYQSGKFRCYENTYNKKH